MLNFAEHFIICFNLEVLILLERFDAKNVEQAQWLKRPCEEIVAA